MGLFKYFNIKNLFKKSQMDQSNQSNPPEEEDWLDFSDAVEDFFPATYDKIIKTVQGIPNLTVVQLKTIGGFIRTSIEAEKNRQVQSGEVDSVLKADINKGMFPNNLLTELGKKINFLMSINKQTQEKQKPTEVFFLPELEEVKKWVYQHATVKDGFLLDFDESKLTTPPDVVKRKFIAFTNLIKNRSKSSQIAQRYLGLVSDLISGETQSPQENQVSAEDDFAQKEEKYKDLPVKILSKGSKGEVVDSYTQYTEHAKKFIELNSDKITKYLSSSSNYKQFPEETRDAYQEAISSSFSPFIEIANQKTKGLVKIDHKDGRLRFFSFFPSHFESVVKILQDNGVNFLEELKSKGFDYVPGNTDALRSSAEAYFLMQKYSSYFFDYLMNLIETKSPDIDRWVQGNVKKNLISIMYKKLGERSGSLTHDDEDGKSVEVGGQKEQRATYYGKETKEEYREVSLSVLSWYQDILNKVKTIKEKIASYYNTKGEYVRKDVLNNLIDTSLEELEKI